MEEERISSYWHPSSSLKATILCMFLLQFVRNVGIAITAYEAYDSLIVKNKDAMLFDDVDQEQERSNDSEDTFIEVAALIAPFLEIGTSVTIIFIFMAPMSEGIFIRQWFGWLLMLRIAWMRMLWTATAVVYVVLYMDYRSQRYEDTRDEAYHDDNLTKTRMWAIAFEYLFLGFLECVIKVYTVERLEERVSKAKRRMRGVWGLLSVTTYLICCCTYAIRNFSMSLYFGILSVSVTQMEQEKVDNLGIYNIIVVLQIYLALMRGRYFNFYIRLCFGYFLAEEDDFKFKTDDEQREQLEAKKKRIAGVYSKKHLSDTTNEFKENEIELLTEI